jgi:hypothetical protein
MKAQLTLAIFDDKLMNGLDFCEKVYDLVENITNSPNGIEALQSQNSSELKKLVEKLIPLSKYIQGCYGPNRRLKVRWIDGRDGYNAQVLSSGAFLDKRASPRRHWIEITNVVQESNPHLPLPPSKRPLMFEVKGISVDRTTQKMTSRPYRYGSDKAEADLAKKILEQIEARGALKHQPLDILVISNIIRDGYLFC